MIEKEALGIAAECCKVVPAVLGEQIGDYAAMLRLYCEEIKCRK